MTFVQRLGDLHTQGLDSLIPDGDALSGQPLRRARLLVGILCYALLFGSLLFIVRYVNSGWVASTQSALIGPILLGLLLVFYRRFNHLNQVADLAVLLTMLSLFSTAYNDGGLTSRALIWLPAIPLVSQFIAHTMRAFMTFFLLSLLLLALYYLHLIQVIKNPLPSDSLFGRMVTAIFSLMFVAIVARVYDHSRRLLNNALIAQKEKAEAAYRHKSEFLANMSHELRTPFNGVLGMLELLLNSSLTQEQRHRAALARSSAESLLLLINDILDFSKVEAGKQELEFIDFDLRELLGDLAEALAFQAEVKGLELILDFKGVKKAWVHGDPTRLRQVLSNLLSNAIKFTRHGEVIICADLQQVDGNILLSVVVSDTGMGIPVDKLDSLFEQFTQVQSSTSREFGGTGLGLAIVKKLCELMDGSVSVTSQLGVGSKFTVSINLQAAKSLIQVDSPIILHGQKILLVDDNAKSLQVLNTQLQGWGAQVSTAQTVKEALAVLSDTSNVPFELALIDLKMPDVDGIELAKILKEQNNKPFQSSEIKIVLMTPIESIANESSFSALGISACFPKPATYGDLQSALSLLVQQGDQSGDSPGSEPKKLTHTYIDTMHHDGSEIRILVVDDNAINLEVASAILDDLGYTAFTAFSGQDAINMLKNCPDKSPFHGVVMDCQMPVMDGLQTTQAIRRGEGGQRYSNVPIIALTANAMRGDKEICIEAGMNGYLSKPLDVKKLCEAIVTLIEPGISKDDT